MRYKTYIRRQTLPSSSWLVGKYSLLSKRGMLHPFNQSLGEGAVMDVYVSEPPHKVISQVQRQNQEQIHIHEDSPLFNIEICLFAVMRVAIRTMRPQKTYMRTIMDAMQRYLDSL